MQPTYFKIYETIVGSHAYGTNIETSDIDIKGIAIPDIKHVIGIHPFEQHIINKDYTIFALKKFIQLASECNPNMIEMLFTDGTDIKYINEYGKLLRNYRDIFISKKAKFTFAGYAYSQLQRIKNHKRWINNPQCIPKKEDFIVSHDIQLSDNTIKTIEKFDSVGYDLAYKKYVQCETWKKERNPARAKLENICGYDSKHGMHLLRLLRMGKEILISGTVIVKRPDYEYLLEVRNGNIPYDNLTSEAEQLLLELDDLYVSSSIPKTVDSAAIEQLLIGIQNKFYQIPINTQYEKQMANLVN